MPTKKILTVSTSGLEKVEGISTVILDNYSLFDKDDFDLDIVAAGDFLYPLAWKFEKIGVTVQHIPSRKNHIIKYIGALVMLFRKNKYDALYVHGSSAIMSIELVTAKFCGCRVRVTHSHNTTCDHKKMDKLLRPVFYRSYTIALACGDAAGKWLYGDRPFHVINNGRSIEKYKFSSEKRDVMRDKLSLRNDEMAIGHVGNFNDQKNQIYLVYVLKELLHLDSNVKLFLIGDGKKRRDVEKEFEKQGIRDWVVFTGAIDYVPDVLQAMDVMLLPSLHEGFPLVAVEWQISGLECVFSDRVTYDCAYTDLVHFLPLNNNFKAWAEQIIKLKGYDRQKSSDLAVELTREQGFDLDENARMLQSYFTRADA